MDELFYISLETDRSSFENNILNVVCAGMTADSGFDDPPTDTEFCNSATLTIVNEYT